MLLTVVYVEAVRGWLLGGVGVALPAAGGDVPHCAAPPGRLGPVHSEGLGGVSLSTDTTGPRVSYFVFICSKSL